MYLQYPFEFNKKMIIKSLMLNFYIDVNFFILTLLFNALFISLQFTIYIYAVISYVIAVKI